MTHSSLEFIYPVYLMKAHQRYFAIFGSALQIRDLRCATANIADVKMLSLNLRRPAIHVSEHSLS